MRPTNNEDQLYNPVTWQKKPVSPILHAEKKLVFYPIGYSFIMKLRIRRKFPRLL